jgi:hypothetical protein
MKSLQFIYQDTEIHFLINPLDNNVMINATEMAKPFNKEVRSFLRLDGTQNYIKTLLEKENIRTDVYGYNDQNRKIYTEEDFVKTNNKAGTIMHRKLALKFAAWLDVDFEVWIFDTIDEIIFGHYKKHWQAHAIQEQSKVEMESIKKKLLIEPTPELVLAYFEEEKNVNNAKRLKSEAIRNQLKLFIQ